MTNRILKKKIMFISSTGGHLAELLQLEPLFSDYDFNIVTENTETARYLSSQYPGRTRFLLFGSKDHPFPYIFKFAYNCLLSLI